MNRCCLDGMGWITTEEVGLNVLQHYTTSMVWY